jgi:hypothetical protein
MIIEQIKEHALELVAMYEFLRKDTVKRINYDVDVYNIKRWLNYNI